MTNWGLPLLLVQNDLPLETRPPYDPITENIIWRSSWNEKGCNKQQVDVIH